MNMKPQLESLWCLQAVIRGPVFCGEHIVNLLGRVSRIQTDSVITPLSPAVINTLHQHPSMWVVHDTSADVLHISLVALLENDPLWDASLVRFVSNTTRSNVVGTQLHVIYRGVEKVFNLDADGGNVWDPCIGFKHMEHVAQEDRDEYKKIKLMVTNILTCRSFTSLAIKGHSFL
jgi:hypothetical protein